MNIEYTRTAYPTLYNGRQYRSRLEAKWAAFFARLGWQFEYEPFDLGSWSPDFLLRGTPLPILVEVKPITDFNEEVAGRMRAAVKNAGIEAELLLVGVDPFIAPQPDEPDDAWLGWLDHADFPGERGGFAACLGVTPPSGGIDFCHCHGSYHGRMTNAHDGTHYIDPWALNRAKPLWDAACNAVQWKCR